MILAVAWVLTAMVGVGYGAYVIGKGRRDLRELERRHLNGARRHTARSLVRTEGLRVIDHGLALIVGAGALLQVPWILAAVGIYLVASRMLMVLNTALADRWREHSIELLERARQKERQQTAKELMHGSIERGEHE